MSFVNVGSSCNLRCSPNYFHRFRSSVVCMRVDLQIVPKYCKNKAHFNNNGQIKSNASYLSNIEVQSIQLQIIARWMHIAYPLLIYSKMAISLTLKSTWIRNLLNQNEPRNEFRWFFHSSHIPFENEYIHLLNSIWHWDTHRQTRSKKKTETNEWLSEYHFKRTLLTEQANHNNFNFVR